MNPPPDVSAPAAGRASDPSAEVPAAGRWLLASAGLFALTRIVVIAAAYAAPQHRDRPQFDWWSEIPLMRWDSGHYEQILLYGYPEQITDTVAFFPLYPLVVRPVARVLHPEVAMLAVSHAAALIAVMFFFAWARRHTDGRTAFAACALLATYPAAMFFSTGYADGLFVMFVAVAIWLLDRRRIGAAAVVTGLATATRPTGLALAAVVPLWSLMANRMGGGARRVARAVVVGCVCLSGFFAYQVYLWRHYGRIDAFAVAQEHWPHRTREPGDWAKVVLLRPVIEKGFRPIKYLFRGQFAELWRPRTWNAFWNACILGLAVAGLARSRLPRLLFLLPILVFLMGWLPDPVDGGRLTGIARYQLIALPCFLLAAQKLAARPVTTAAVCTGLMVLQVAYIFAYVDWILPS